MTKYSTILCLLLLSVFFIIVDSCNENCVLGKSHCDLVTGTCLYGCRPGWSGDTCINRCNIDKCLECYTFKNNTQICDRCEEGFFGNKCENTCSSNCISGRCNSFGDCVFGCKPHWTGRRCDEQHCDIDNCLECGFSSVYRIPICKICSVGRFFSFQQNECVNCSEQCVGEFNTCNQTTGNCYNGCMKGYYGYNCDRICLIDNCEQCVLVQPNHDTAKCGRCSQDWYPQDLTCVKCSEHCKGGISNCNSSTGVCEQGCKEGWFRPQCDKECLIPNCQTCAEDRSQHTYCAACNSGMYFHYELGKCVNCSDNCAGGRVYCNQENGACLNGCKAGYYGGKCQWLCGNCTGRACLINGTCPHGCKNGWYGIYCSQTFPEHCLDGVSFHHNGMCGDCEASWYGQICDKKCSLNCRPSVYNGYVYCHKMLGQCVSGCMDGYYGEACTLPCSKNCNYNYCDQTSGVCQNGCEFKFYGNYCDKNCPDNCKRGCHRTLGTCDQCKYGFFGTFCEKPCNTGCKNGNCYEQTGACIDGCVDGYYGNVCNRNCSENCLYSVCEPFQGKCSKGCVDGRYGQFCQYECNDCFNSTCEQESGSCLHGCMEGKTGENCDQVCSPGTYGENCASLCTFCRNKACHAVTGECNFGCDIGYTGPLCQDIVPLYPSAISTSNTNTIAIAAGVTTCALLILAVLIIFYILYKRNHLHMCSKPRKRDLPNAPGVEMEVLNTPLKVGTEDDTIEAADLQLFPVIVAGQRFEVKFGTYGNNFRTTQVMVRILSRDRNGKDAADFYNDVNILRTLPKQKNIVYFLGTGHTKEYSFSVYELCGSGVMLSYLRNLTESCREPTSIILQRNLSDILTYCLGVVSGLEYLLHKKILHRHIAAVNIFIDEYKKSKIGNFFYAANIETEREEVKSSQLPVDCYPWLPQESIRHQLFSSKSEIFSFGIFLWEVMTLGEDVGTVRSKLSDDDVLPKPDGCDEALYHMITQCLEDNPRLRPSLQYIYQMISDLIDDNVQLIVRDNNEQIDLEEEYGMKSTAV